MKITQKKGKAIADFSKEEGPTWRACVYTDPRDNKVHVAPMLAVGKEAAVEISVWWHSYLTERYGRVPPLGTIPATEPV